MKTVFEHIEHIQGKPHHVRRRFAFAFAAGASGLIAFVWLTSNLVTGSFAIQGSNFAMTTGQDAAVVVASDSENQGLAGVGAAAALTGAKAPAHIEIVDTNAAPKKQVEQTTIPF